MTHELGAGTLMLGVGGAVSVGGTALGTVLRLGGMAGAGVTLTCPGTEEPGG